MVMMMVTSDFVSTHDVMGSRIKARKESPHARIRLEWRWRSTILPREIRLTTAILLCKSLWWLFGTDNIGENDIFDRLVIG